MIYVDVNLPDWSTATVSMGSIAGGPWWDNAHSGTDGEDIFTFRRDHGHDRITGFGTGDLIRFTIPGLTYANLAFAVNQDAGTITIKVPNGGAITLEGVAAFITEEGGHTLTADMFHFAGDPSEKTTGTDGNDVLQGAGEDVNVSGGDGHDVLLGTEGGDSLSGGDGHDHVLGYGGDDRLKGGDGDDRLEGGIGDDLGRGGKGDDWLDGGHGDDTLYGGKGDDTLYGAHGDDLLYGGQGNDRLDGGIGDDRLKGGNGDDTLDGGSGDDTMTGGAGSDVFVYDHGQAFGDDTITDFEVGADVIQLDLAKTYGDDTFRFFVEVSDNAEGDAVIQFKKYGSIYSHVDGSITLEGVEASELTDSDFMFV